MGDPETHGLDSPCSHVKGRANGNADPVPRTLWRSYYMGKKASASPIVRRQHIAQNALALIHLPLPYLAVARTSL